MIPNLLELFDDLGRPRISRRRRENHFGRRSDHEARIQRLGARAAPGKAAAITTALIAGVRNIRVMRVQSPVMYSGRLDRFARDWIRLVDS